MYRTPGFSPLTFHFKLTSSTSRARAYKLRLPDWTWLWKEGACGILALCVCSRKGGTSLPHLSSLSWSSGLLQLREGEGIWDAQDRRPTWQRKKDSSPISAACSLCDLGQVTSCLWAPLWLPHLRSSALEVVGPGKEPRPGWVTQLESSKI